MCGKIVNTRNQNYQHNPKLINHFYTFVKIYNTKIYIMTTKQLLKIIQNAYIAYLITIDKNQKYTASFFTPKTISQNYTPYINTLSDAFCQIIQAEISQNQPPILNTCLNDIYMKSIYLN